MAHAPGYRPPQKFAPVEPPSAAHPVAAAIVKQLGPVLEAAAKSFGSDSGARFSRVRPHAFAASLLRHVHRLLPLFAQYPAAPDPDARFMPPCFVCGAPAGSHWPHLCPRVVEEQSVYLVYDYRRKKVLRYRDCQDYTAGGPTTPGPFAPTCGVCGKGNHWPDACPENPLREIMELNKVLSREEQRHENQTDEDQWETETGLPPNSTH